MSGNYMMMRFWKRLFKRSEPMESTEPKKSESRLMLERLIEINKTRDYNALVEFAKEIGAYVPERTNQSMKDLN